MTHLSKICEGYDVDIEVISQREPSAISSENTKGFETIKEKIAQLYPDAIVSSYITIGGTDAYKYQIILLSHLYIYRGTVVRNKHKPNSQLGRKD